jgi:predicted nucleic acid-binding protein
MSSNILSFEECMYIDFSRKSINLDTCFILAYLDSDDQRGDKVADIINKWSLDKISSIAISNHVAAEVIHNIFKNRIREVVYLSYKKKKSKGSKREYTFTNEEQAVVGNSRTGEKLTSLLKDTVLERLYKKGELSCNFESLLKDFKSTFPEYTEHLSRYYLESTEKFYEFIDNLKETLQIDIIDTPISDIYAQRNAVEHMSEFQLGIFDAFHLALTSEYDYFATLDGDFTNAYISKGYFGLAKILKIA